MTTLPTTTAVKPPDIAHLVEDLRHRFGDPDGTGGPATSGVRRRHVVVRSTADAPLYRRLVRAVTSRRR